MSLRPLPRPGVLLLGALALAGSLHARVAGADTVVIPNAQTSSEGGASNVFPFGATVFSPNNPFRSQQVYGAVGFGVEEPITITELRFRADTNNTFITPIVVQDIEVRLSTTAKEPDALDNVDHDANLGLDSTLVYDGGLNWPAPSAGIPRPFELPIVFTTPFEYDPTAGNLLVEVYNLSESFPLEYGLDAHSATDETSRVLELKNKETGDPVIPAASTIGLVTQFVYTVPEAESLASSLVALLAVGALARGHRA
jgi:hypothetical protein